MTAFVCAVHLELQSDDDSVSDPCCVRPRPGCVRPRANVGQVRTETDGSFSSSAWLWD